MKIYLLPFCRYFYTYHFSSYFSTNKKILNCSQFGLECGHHTSQKQVMTSHNDLPCIYSVSLDLLNIGPLHGSSWSTWYTTIQKISIHPKASCHLPYQHWKWDASYKDRKKGKKINVICVKPYQTSCALCAKFFPFTDFPSEEISPWRTISWS